MERVNRARKLFPKPQSHRDSRTFCPRPRSNVRLWSRSAGPSWTHQLKLFASQVIQKTPDRTPMIWMATLTVDVPCKASRQGLLFRSRQEFPLGDLRRPPEVWDKFPWVVMR